MSDNCKKIGKLSALALLSQIPIASAFSKFCEDFVNSNWQERIDLWKEEVIKRLSQLDTEMEERIRNTSNFASILASAQRGALEDMEEDKVSLYANTLVNAIRNENIDDVKTHIFLNMLRKYSKMHIDILKECLRTHCSTVDTILDDIFCKRTNYVPENKIHPIRLIDRRFHTLDIRYQIIAELYNDNLFDVYIDNSRIHPHASSGINKELSSLAVEFLAFISEQEAKNE